MKNKEFKAKENTNTRRSYPRECGKKNPTYQVVDGKRPQRQIDISTHVRLQSWPVQSWITGSHFLTDRPVLGVGGCEKDRDVKVPVNVGLGYGDLWSQDGIWRGFGDRSGKQILEEGC